MSSGNITRNGKHGRTFKRMYETLHKAFGPQNWWPGETPFEVAVGAILTQNTNWGNVEKAIANLKKAKALNPGAISGMPHDDLAELIRPSGYFNVKARRLRHFTDFLIGQYGGSMRRLAKENAGALRQKLLGINGIGPETADSILLYAANKPVFVIDAYTKRVLSRHGVAPGLGGYDDYQGLFHHALPPDEALYNEYHALFVMLGKHYCKPKPACGACPLGGK